MQPAISNDELQDAQEAFRARLARCTLRPGDRLDVRTVVSLQTNGLLTDMHRDSILLNSSEILEQLDSGGEPKLPPGPTLFYRTSETRSEYTAVDVTELLLDVSEQVRAAAMKYLLRPIDGEVALTPKTRSVLAAVEHEVVSAQFARWAPAALRVYDAVKDDLLLALAGLRQALPAQFEQGAAGYLRKVITPSVSSLDSIDLEISKPGKQRGELEKHLSRLADAGSIEEICTQFFRRFGHLPLDQSVSLAIPVRVLLTRGTDSSTVWQSVWRWVESVPSPFAQYHACVLFIALPELVPLEGKTQLWRAICELVIPRTRSEQVAGLSAFLIRRSMLARHYLQHLAERVPGADSERLSVFSWWLTDRAEMILTTCGDLAAKLTESFVQEAINETAVAADLSGVTLEPSDLGYATRFLESTWSFSILSQLDGRISEIANQETLNEYLQQSADDGAEIDRDGHVAKRAIDRLSNGICRALTQMFPGVSCGQLSRVYGFEAGINGVARDWARYVSSDEGRNLLQSFDTMSTLLAEVPELMRELKVAAAGIHATRTLVFEAVRYRICAGTLPLDAAWEMLVDGSWLKGLLLVVEEDLLGILMDIFIELELRQDDRWRAHLPHLLANVCDECEDANRRSLLFGCVIRLSVASGTASAVRRLLSGPDRGSYTSQVDLWREQLLAAQSTSPPGLAGRIRQMLASLHVA